ncbi:MAG: 2-nitropropane dioxygenase, partial [Desulfamplus sp.]|nr:2-nitropropane dioxygenase [Desulfamplus sp.]
MQTVGYIDGNNLQVTYNINDFTQIIQNIRKPVHIIYDPNQKSLGLALNGKISSNAKSNSKHLVAAFPALYPEWLGDRRFLETHRVRFAYVGGAMARGITSVDMVVALAKSGMLGFLGSAGLPLDQLEKELQRLAHTLNPLGLSWGCNLIHTPDDAMLEEKTVDLFLKYGVLRISASAYLGIVPSIVRYVAKGLTVTPQGMIKRNHFVFAKVSRPEIAKIFLSPPPEKILHQLKSSNQITALQADIARHVPLAADIEVEGDSGGHTDNRPLNALFPVILSLSRELSQYYNYQETIRIGAGGGIGTPEAVASAFA